MLVIDASVFNKLFLDEPDRPQAQRLFRHSIEKEVPLLAPSLLLYEALSAVLHYGVDFEDVHALLDAQRAAGMRLVEPDLAVLKRAETIAATAGENGGYPGLQDAIYHALALETGAMFVTADKRYAAKVREIGGVVLLKDWQPSLRL